MSCKLCQKRGKTWKGDDPKCAFENGKFSSDNWACATMDELRGISMQLDLHYRDDDGAGSFGAVPVVTDDDTGFVVMTWYKNRGRTSQAYVIWDIRGVSELTEEIALQAIEYAKDI